MAFDLLLNVFVVAVDTYIDFNPKYLALSTLKIVK